ncbi:Protein MGM1, mitochondrial, partial [Candida maltosa Xu316]
MIPRNGRLLIRRPMMWTRSLALLRSSPVQTHLKHTPRYIPVRNIGFFKIITRAVKVPAYVGGTLAAGGSYVAYKVEQASSFTSDKLSAFKDFADGVFDKTGDFLKTFGKEGDGSAGQE